LVVDEPSGERSHHHARRVGHVAAYQFHACANEAC